MSDPILERANELACSARKLAIIGAALKLRCADAGQPVIREQIEQGLEQVLGDAFASLQGSDAREALGMIEMALVESADLFQKPEHAGGWRVVDPVALEAMGRASASAFDRIRALAEIRPSLSNCLAGRFLDVGTGVGGIALRAAESCPTLEVEAIDIWRPALDLAAQRISASPHGQRITLRELDVTQLNGRPRFTLVWLPTMFMQRLVVQQAIERVASISLGGAWLVAAVYTIPADPFAAVTARLRTLRSGGEILDPEELVNLFRLRGYVGVEVSTGPIATLVLGRLPGW